LDQDESIDRWTLVGDEPDPVAGKRGATRLITDHEEGSVDDMAALGVAQQDRHERAHPVDDPPTG
jgi:hypothetical protein